jgi:predicted regulator of Ras-like GTPase activity (Roadblock/LC7/MglB family)
VIQQRGNFDWMLKQLADGVPGVEMIVVLSADGLRIARHGGDPDAAGDMNLVLIEIDRGYFYLMSAGANAYLAVLADVTCEPGRMSEMMRDLVVRIGAHLTSPPRRNGQTV